MTPEVWELAGVPLLAVAIVAGIREASVPHRRWQLIATGARLGALGVLIVAVVLSMVAQGGWSPFDLRQLAISVATLSLAWGLILSRVWESTVPDPVLDAAVLLIVLVTTLAIRRGGPPLECAQRSFLFVGQWVLFVLGAGSAVVASSLALSWAIRRFVPPAAAQWVSSGNPDRPFSEAVWLTLLFLGAGLLLSILWAWRTYGSLSTGDPRQAWLAAAWLVAAMSAVAWQLERRSRAWASLLAGVAGVAVLAGLLIVLDLQRLLGI
jgi:hypothetical protein